MGHIYDRNMHLYQPVSLYQAAASAGSATFTLTKSGNLWYLRCVGGATGEPHAIAVKQVISPYLACSADTPGYSQKGFCLKRVTIWYYPALNVTSVAAALYQATAPADGAAWGSASAMDVSYDADHDAAAERIADQYHRMTLTLTSPTWLAPTTLYTVEFQSELGNSGEVYLIHGVRAEGEIRL